MIRFTTTIQKFDQHGDKTGWTYVTIPAKLAQELIPGNKKALRVKGYIDDCSFEGVSLTPMGGGDFILALNSNLRRRIKKRKGDELKISLEVDTAPLRRPTELLECLADEPEATRFFDKLAPSHQKYFINWINEAKTDPTKTRRLAHTLNALKNELDFGTMIRSISREKKASVGLKEI